MAFPRFYTPKIAEKVEFAENIDFSLLDEEASHAIKSLRIKEGDIVVGFDGQGWQTTAKVVAIKKHEVCCVGTERTFLPGILPGEVTMGISLPKGDRQRSVVERLVELGVHRLIPLQTARSVAEGTEGAIARLQRYAIEACKQCGRNQILEVAHSISLERFYELDFPIATQRWIAHPYPPNERAMEVPLPTLKGNPTTGIPKFAIVIGPEGGLTEKEVALGADSGWKSIRLGPRILRVETAVSYVGTLVNWFLDPPIIYADSVVDETTP